LKDKLSGIMRSTISSEHRIDNRSLCDKSILIILEMRISFHERNKEAVRNTYLVFMKGIKQEKKQDEEMEQTKQYLSCIIRKIPGS
jgi:hypothetical protein